MIVSICLSCWPNLWYSGVFSAEFRSFHKNSAEPDISRKYRSASRIIWKIWLRGLVMWSSPSDRPVSLVFWCQEWLMSDERRLCSGNIWVQRGRPPYENSQAVHISPHNSETIIASEKSAIIVNRKSTMSFPTSHQTRLCVTPNFPKMRFRLGLYRIWVFSIRPITEYFTAVFGRIQIQIVVEQKKKTNASR